MSDLNDILSPGAGSNKKQPLSEDKLMAYLEGKLPAQEQHEVEQWLADEGMESDAVEGLNTIAPMETKTMVDKLNHTLGKATKKTKKRRKPLKTNELTIIAIAMILMLAVIAFVILKMIKG